MITQNEADALLAALKEIHDPGAFQFPGVQQSKRMQLISSDHKHKFIVDVNRPGSIRINKCTYQMRYRTEIILVRLDIDGPEHTNPDGQQLSRNHLHIFKEGYGDSWAIDIPSQFVNINDLVGTLIDFLEYCKVRNYSELRLMGAFA